MPTVHADPLRAAVRRIIAANGSDATEAALVADHMVDANLAGHDSHGVGLLPRYVENKAAGLVEANRHVTVARDDGAMLVVDGNQGYGQVVAREATELAIRRAETHGSCILALRNAHHIGRVGAWGEMCVAAGLISLHYVNVWGHTPLVSPFRGSDARFATNPFCCAVPGTGNRPPMVLDMATSKIAVGKVRVALNKGEAAPPDTLIDHKGQPTTDPAVMFREPFGAIMPFGAHKGYGLALACEILGGALTGGGTIQPARRRDGRIINNMLMVVIDPARLVDMDFFRAEFDAMLDYAQASPPADPSEPVLVPGEPERLMRAARNESGIPVDDTTWSEIVAAGETLGVAAEETRALAGLA